MTAMRGRLLSLVIQVGFLAALLAAWQHAATSGANSPLLLPPPGAVWSALADVVSRGEFLGDLTVSLHELGLAFALAAVSGLAIGYACSRTRFRIRVFDPLLSALYAIPTVLFFPLFVLFFGIGEGSKIAMGASIAFFPVALNTMAGFGTIDPVLVRAARAMGAQPFALFRFVLLPAAFPLVLAGLRIGCILAFLAILGTESITAVAGLGYRIVTLADALDIARMYAYVAIAIAAAGALNLLLHAVERWGRQ